MKGKRFASTITDDNADVRESDEAIVLVISVLGGSPLRTVNVVTQHRMHGKSFGLGTRVRLLSTRLDF